MNLLSSLAGAVSNAVSTAASVVSSAVNNVVSTAKSAAQSVVSAVSNTVNSAVTTAQKAVSNVVNTVSSVINSANNSANSAVKTANNSASTCVVSANNSVNNAAKTTASSAKQSAQTASNFTTNAINAAKDSTAFVLNVASDAVNSVLQNENSGYSSYVNSVIDTAENIINNISSAAQTITNPLQQTLTVIYNFFNSLFYNTLQLKASYDTFNILNTHPCLVFDENQQLRGLRFPTSESFLNAQGTPGTDWTTPVMGAYWGIGIAASSISMSNAVWQPQISYAQQESFSRFPTLTPSATDLVSFQLREVFNPDYRAEQLVPYPSEDYFKYMLRQGYNRYWAENFWAAHWELPNVSQAYEMFWRLRENQELIIDNEKIEVPKFSLSDLKKLLTRLDILPAYQNQLIAIAYAPYTRVDIRRMYKLKVLDYNEMIQAYQDLGYSPFKAHKLAEFTQRDVDDDDIMTIRSELMDAYKNDEIDSETVVKLIKPTFRNPEFFDLWMSLIDKKKTRKAKAEVEKDIKTKEKLPTLTNVKNWYKAGLLNEKQAFEYLIKLNYSEDNAILYLLEWQGKKIS